METVAFKVVQIGPNNRWFSVNPPIDWVKCFVDPIGEEAQKYSQEHNIPLEDLLKFKFYYETQDT